QATSETPRYVNNYFGTGNETGRNMEVDRRYYRVQKEHYRAFVGLKQSKVSGVYFALAPLAEAIKINLKDNSFLKENPNSVRPEVFDYQYFGGAKALFSYTNIERHFNPERGINFQTNMSWRTNLQETGRQFMNVNSSLALYLPFDKNSI